MWLRSAGMLWLISVLGCGGSAPVSPSPRTILEVESEPVAAAKKGVQQDRVCLAEHVAGKHIRVQSEEHSFSLLLPWSDDWEIECTKETIFQAWSQKRDLGYSLIEHTAPEELTDREYLEQLFKTSREAFTQIGGVVSAATYHGFSTAVVLDFHVDLADEEGNPLRHYDLWTSHHHGKGFRLDAHMSWTHKPTAEEKKFFRDFLSHFEVTQ